MLQGRALVAGHTVQRAQRRSMSQGHRLVNRPAIEIWEGARFVEVTIQCARVHKSRGTGNPVPADFRSGLKAVVIPDQAQR